MATQTKENNLWSQDTGLPPTISPTVPLPPPQVAPQLPPLRMQPLNQLPGQANPNPNFAGQGAAAGAGSAIFNPSGSFSRAAVGQAPYAPNMIGDGFGPAPFTVTPAIEGVQGTAQSEFGTVTVPGSGGSVGTMKIAENTSPIPRDRVFLNYSYFNGVPLTNDGVNVNRLTPGFEKTFFQGMSSVEVRAPFASTLASNLYTQQPNGTDSTQFGNLTLYVKQLLFRNEVHAVSVGLGIALPTSNNQNVYANPNFQLLSIKNQSVHLLPFLGSLYTPSDNLFVQQFLQFDFDTTGNPVEINDFNGGTRQIGRLQDMTYLYYSLGAGYWIYNNPDSDRFFSRIAPIIELHYNKSLTSSDVVPSFLVDVGQSGINQDLLNGTIGLTALMGDNKTLTVGYVTPLSSIDHRQFNSEFRVMFNWFFGAPLNRLTRVQF